MKHGHSLDEFLDDFPTVTREQALAALEIAKQALLPSVPVAPKAQPWSAAACRRFAFAPSLLGICRRGKPRQRQSGSKLPHSKGSRSRGTNLQAWFPFLPNLCNLRIQSADSTQRVEACMQQWFLEPGHTAAEFCVRHMMVTYVRGAFKNVKGRLNFDPAKPEASTVEVIIDAQQLWSGEPDRDAHLKSADFLDAATHPQITFRSSSVRLLGGHDYEVAGNLTIRGVTRPATLRATL
jgi:polyisoprenoid-binding protein YceI